MVNFTSIEFSDTVLMNGEALGSAPKVGICTWNGFHTAKFQIRVQEVSTF
jgi:hypothetical protein